MRLHTALSLALTLLWCASGGMTAYSQDVGIDELKQEMKAPAANNPPAANDAAQAQPEAGEIKKADAAADAVVPAADPAAQKPAEAAPAPASVPPAADVLKDVPKAIPPEEAIKMVGTPERTEAAKMIAQQEEVRRQAREIEGRVSIESADRAWKNGDYALALSNYRTALEKLPAVGPAMSDRKRAMARIPECEYQSVLTLVKLGKKDEALTKGKELIAKNPDNKPLSKLIAKLEQEAAPKPVDTAVGVVGEEKRTEVQQQMHTGKQQMVARQYEKARATFESVLAIEPDNREAMRYLKELGDRKYVSSTSERDATAAKMSAQVREKWNPDYKMIKAAEGPEKKRETDGTSTRQILEKMEKITIPEVEFRQANIHDVVEFLNRASVEGDKNEPDPTKRGINIILNLNPAGTAAPTAAPKPAGEAGLFEAPAPAAGGSAGAQASEITFTARYISLLSALKIITSVAGLRWRVDGNIVMIVPGDYEPGEIEVRMYSVEPTFVERIREAGSAIPAATQTRGGREFQAMGNEGGGTGSLPELEEYFKKMGVKFPQGSSITYNSAIGKVIVANTAENLAVFEKILPELNVVPKQVEIEARFVEVNETDLQEIGLEWLLNDAWEIASKQGGPYTPMAATERIQMNANSADGGFTKGLRFWGTDTANSVTPLASGQGTMGRVLSVSSVLTNPELTMVLHLLQQNGNADLLSAPKVTTRSGTEASIRVVTEYIYPTSFEVQGGTLQGSGTATGAQTVQETTVVPQDFATREVGVILTVLPEVSPDGNMINLTMRPQVVTEPTWFQYGSTVRRADGSSMVLNMPQPFFHVRSIDTQISIYDGATVVMGGLITEELTKVNDKIPVLGDIPLIGILFRSKSERSIKKNLLIFVTAKLVDPGGQLIRNAGADTAARLKAPVPEAPEATPR